jgi:hypothetical protein
MALRSQFVYFLSGLLLPLSNTTADILYSYIYCQLYLMSGLQLPLSNTTADLLYSYTRQQILSFPALPLV